ncbi:MAG: EAL domain-containing protein [Campylobacterota bacterium]|nr:EAL domain-containing protein [Campylobacterota bacterium]
MKTLNITISHPKELEELLVKHSIVDNSKLLIQIFSSNASTQAITLLHQELNRHFAQAYIIGSSSDGAISHANIIDTPDTLLSFSQFEQTDLLSYSANHHEDDYQSGIKLGEFFAKAQPKVLIVFVDAFHSNAERLLEGITKVLPCVVIAGGLASRDESFDETFIFNNHYLSSSGIVAVGLKNKHLNVIENFAFDWMPVGVPKVVTQAVHNRVYKIDNMSAVEFYNKYLGDNVVDHLPDTGIEFPLIIKRDNRYIGRAVLSKHDDGSLSFAGNINIGEKVQFGIGDLDSIIRHSQNYSKILNYNNIESIFIYSCIARRHFLESDIAIELEAFNKIAPTSGFFTFGEFYNHYLLNQSNRYIALSEKPLQKADTKKTDIAQLDNKTNILKALLTLTNATSRDLDQINNSLETKVVKQEEDIKRNIYYDECTNMPNRIKLLEELVLYKDRYLILFNIDRFSRINYFYGFKAGDMLIKEFASYLRSKFENIGILYKLPSDEFVLILTDTNVDIRQLVHSVSHELKMMLFNYQNIKIAYTATMGVAKVIGDGVSMRHADISVNHAKLIHKQYIFYEDIEKENNQVIKDSMSLALGIREAIQENRLCMYYQPIYDIQSGEIYSYEALARFCITSDEMLMPSEFLPILPYIHLSNDFVQMVIEKTFELFAKTNSRFSINLTIEDILDREINDFLCAQLQKYDLYDKITIEILETVEIVESKEIIEFIDRTKSLGIKIAIDDFGSGVANFEYITKINADILKIDGSLIKNINSDTNAKIVVETIVAFAQKLGMKTVAEYVHSKEVYDVIKALGIDYAQGFYLAKPSPYLLT